MFRVLVANEPRAYREAISVSIRQLRPEHEVVAVDPGRLDGELAGFAPDVVICSTRAGCGERRVPAWVALYPDGESRVVVRIDDRCSAAPDLDLTDLLSVIDRTARLARFREPQPAQMS